MYCFHCFFQGIIVGVALSWVLSAVAIAFLYRRGDLVVEDVAELGYD